MSNLSVRHMEFDYDQPIETVFIPNEPETSHFFTGFSIVLHYVEPYLIRSMREAKSLVTDKRIVEDMDKFCRQEAQHYTQHKKFNDHLHVDYPGLKALEEKAKKEYERLSKTKSLKFNLAYAEGFESAATVAALATLENGPLEKAEGFVGDIWRWHFCEELEHRAVTYDVYKHLYGDYLYRTSVGIWSQAHFIKMGLMFSHYLLEADKERILKNYGGKKGKYSRAWKTVVDQKGLVPAILKTYNPFYDPNKLIIPPAIQAMTKHYTEQAIRVL